MSTDQEHASDAAPTTERQPDWWHRDHPTFTSLTGFFTGLAFVILVPSLFIALLNLIFDDDTAEGLFPLVLVGLAVPLVLVIIGKTRRFGLYMLVGMVVTALVVGGVAGLVLWYMVTYQS
ncbi:hypothetical protein ABLE68_16030 [Nocardioides sp. CN2-186]|uniref:hypothetical protein n=1 Tax=Nocardioides tweenelious TaxID=3156607 RepID=UPI0032B5CAAC